RRRQHLRGSAAKRRGIAGHSATARGDAATGQPGGGGADAHPALRRPRSHGLQAGALCQCGAAGRRAGHADGAAPPQARGRARRGWAGGQLQRAPAAGQQAVLRRPRKALRHQGQGMSTQPLAEEDADDDRPLTDQLFEQLSEAIVAGTFAAGAKLSEPRLAAQYGVRRGPVREAIRRREERRLVTRTPRQGVRVVVPTPEDALELFTIREVLEGLAARQAAENALDSEIDALRAMLAHHREALSQPDAMVYWQATANSDFHFMVARIGRNQHLFDLLCGEYYTLFRL